MGKFPAELTVIVVADEFTALVSVVVVVVAGGRGRRHGRPDGMRRRHGVVDAARESSRSCR